MSEHKIRIIGIGDDGPAGLSHSTLDMILDAQFLAGGKRHLAFFPDHTAEKLVINANLKELSDRLRSGLARNERMTVLASGDPMFYGVGGFVAKQFPVDQLDIRPAPSAMQLAFAAAGMAWDSAALVSVHAKPLERLIGPARTADVIGVFTDDGASPGKIAAFLKARGLDDFDAVVCERLGNEQQLVRRFALQELDGLMFDPLNTVILIRKSDAVARVDHDRLDIGLPEESFAHRKPKLGLITKAEIRILSIARLRLFAGAVVWDIGAGSGSVSIEAARITMPGKVYAIEKNAEDMDNVRENISKFRTPNVIAVHGIAPDALSDVPDDPDAVFIGGSAGRMHDILDTVARRLRPDGRIVLNLATIENLSETISAVKHLKLDFSLAQIQVSRGTPILDMTRLDALNPVTIVTAWRPDGPAQGAG